MAKRKLAAIDCETKPIESRPDYPPPAVGVAVKRQGRKAEYLAFGHPSRNNCTRAEAVRYVRDVLREYDPVFHNAPFDIEVLDKLGVKVRGEYHDTMVLAFLNEPRSIDLGLKPQADAHLKMRPTEQRLLHDWVRDHIPEAKKKAKKGKVPNWGDYIHMTPGDMCGIYAKGDVDRTEGLYHHFQGRLDEIDASSKDAHMREAYEREMAVLPIKVKMEQTGIRVRLAKLKKEYPAYVQARDDLERTIKKRLGVSKVRGPQLAEALVKKGLLSHVVRTAPSDRHPDGQVSTNRTVLEQYCTDKKLVEMLALHGTLSTYTNMFMENWIDRAERNDGYVQPTFNTVRGTDEFDGSKGGKGTRTGRFSSSDPNLQNIPSNAEGSAHEKTLLILQKLLARYGVDFIGLRDYFQPDEGCVFIRRDYNQQELRFLAHYDYDHKRDRPGAFLKMYIDNPKLDGHDLVKELVLRIVGIDYPRKFIKNTNFGLIYGMGLHKLAARLDLSHEDAKTLRNAVLKAVPGIKMQMQELKRLASRDEPFYTWGGRQYYCEEPILIRVDEHTKIKKQLDYRMMNTRIQGSSADCTKRGMVNVDQNMRHGRLVLQVHDELVASVPRRYAREEMARMKEAMEDVVLRLPMLSDGDIGKVSWARLEETDSSKRGYNNRVWRGL